MAACGAYVHHGADARGGARRKAVSRERVRLGDVDGAAQVHGDVVGRVLHARVVDDYLGLKPCGQVRAVAHVRDEVSVALVLDACLGHV